MVLRLAPDPAGQADAARQIVARLRGSEFTVGHNVDAHDLGILARYQPAAADLVTIDTLRLSPLAFPEKQSHALTKSYKEDGAWLGNDPAQDALLSMDLLRSQLDAFEAMDPAWLRILHFLTTLGRGTAGCNALFNEVRGHGVDHAPPCDTGVEVAGVLADLRGMFDGQLCLEGYPWQQSRAWCLPYRRSEPGAGQQRIAGRRLFYSSRCSMQPARGLSVLPGKGGDEKIDAMSDTIRQLRTGDPLFVGPLGSGNKERRSIRATADRLAGETSGRFLNDDGGELAARVFAVVFWRNEDNRPEWRPENRLENWWVAIPEILSV